MVPLEVVQSIGALIELVGIFIASVKSSVYRALVLYLQPSGPV